MKFTRLLTLGFLFTGALLFGQNSNNPWQISAGFTFPSVTSDITAGGSTISNSDLGSAFGAPQLGLYRRVFGGLSIGGQLALGTITNDASTSDFEFYSMHAALKYNFSADNKFSPYLKAGVYGSTSLKDGTDSASRFTDYSNFGTVGFDLALGEKLGAYAEYSIGKINETPEVDYGLLSIGLTYGFGSGDSDKDGVNDKKDKCPDVPGLKEFEGCPDTDGDGIPDPQDDCPEEAGPAENNGCPDTDGDGVLDKDDACPDEAGLADLNGCPDSDEDGVANPDDECPEEAGPAENNGCPWPDTDGDGVVDKDDECPEDAGKGANGCPELTDEILSTINKVGENILFPANSSRIMGQKAMDALKEVKAILDQNPQGVIVIEGYASADGSEEYNLKLSEKRAEAVKNKLVELGADASRIETKAYGESKTAGEEPNATQDRRVEFKRKQ